ncbi:hypothetical protein BGZ96_011777 [Linnemannia gamsii]|uniref:Carboxylesterase type B domain-containing protein n=1 Tax=Linnemannia gamsii TaxID=64522 RepID=A0ABQ7KAZ1_9FUNG|nr:hypothetical protein BGZ96_011777 [Linnemannia gamsii]
MLLEGDKNPIITIPGLGVIKGTLDPSGKVAKFLNVPFGTVEERWQPAVKAQPWSGIRDATQNGPMSPQQTENHPFISMLLGCPSTNDYDETMSERDCLHCNIFMPASALTSLSEEKEELLPVMVWIYGGAYRSGTNSTPLYDCTEMLLTGIDLQKPFIAVAINYRVNYLGFLASKELLLDSHHHLSRTIPADQQRKWYDGSVGNWGLLDQILGLEWVRDHIFAFRGDKGRVTAMGESAGAVSISLLMLIPQAHGLFRRAILQSGGASASPLVRPEGEGSEGQVLFDHLCLRFGVQEGLDPLEKVAQLRHVDAKEFAKILNLAEIFFFRPALDGVLFQADSRVVVGEASAYDRGLEWVVTGNCKDEGTVFGPLIGAPFLADFPNLKRRLCPPSDSHLFDTLFGTPHSDNEAATISNRLAGNGIFKYPSYQISQAILDHPTCRLSRFHFDTQIHAEEQVMPGLGAHHGIDMFFTFGGKVAKDLLSESEQGMIRKVQEVWIEVITAESPESSTLPKITTTNLLPSSPTDSFPKEAIVFGNDMKIHQDVAERMSTEEIEFWKRAQVFAKEETDKGRGREVFFDYFQGTLTSTTTTAATAP